MLPQYHAVKASGLCDPVIVIVDERAFGLAENLRSDGIRVELIPDELRQDPVQIADKRFQDGLSRLPSVLSAILRCKIIAHSFLLDGWRGRTVVKRYTESLQAWLSYLEGNWIDLAMVPLDTELVAFTPLIKHCKLNLIQFVISTSNIPTRDSLAANRVGERKFDASFAKFPPLWNVIARLFFPQQVAETVHGKMLFSPGWLVCALARLGMLSKTPWIQGGGNCDFVLLNSQRRCEKYISEGVDPRKVVQIGDLSFDTLHASATNREALRAKIRQKFTGGDGKVCLFAIPIYAEHNYLNWDVHLSTLRACAAKLRASGMVVVLSLHPRSRKEDYLFLEKDFGFDFDSRPLNQILPAADVFICGNSSTIEWSVLLGQPTINLDYAGINDGAFLEYPGVLSARSADEFSLCIEQVQQDYEMLRQAQLDKAETISIFDGNSKRRFLAFVTTQLAQASSKATV